MIFNKGYKYKRRKHSKLWLLLFSLLIIIIGSIIYSAYVFQKDLKSLSSISTSQIFIVNRGDSINTIANNLEKAKLIRSAWAFELYVHIHESSRNLIAGTYDLSPSQDVPKIVTILNHGKVATKLVTILPGARIDQVRATLINSGFSPSAVDNALNPSNYSDLSVLAFKPVSVNTLEGLLWPDSYQKDPSTDPSIIIRESLQEMSNQLTPAVQQGFANEGLTTYQGIILTSIILQEVNKSSDQTQVAQVFLSRLKANMVLGSDVTAFYGDIVNNIPPNLNYNTPYNTLLNKGLPPSPISNINDSALYAATHPSNTNWLYFVAGDNGNTYFSTNFTDHQNQVNQYCHKLCSN